jgi:hypothetical protein
VRLEVSYTLLGLSDEAWKASAVLGKNYPATYWYRQSLRLLTAERKHTGGRAFSVAGETPLTTGAPAAATPEAPKASRNPQGQKANGYPQCRKPTEQ